MKSGATLVWLGLPEKLGQFYQRHWVERIVSQSDSNINGLLSVLVDYWLGNETSAELKGFTQGGFHSFSMQLFRL